MVQDYKYNFVLSSFGLDYLRPRLFRSVSFKRDGEQGDSAAEFKSVNQDPAEKIKDSALGTPVFDNVILADNLKNPTLKIEIDVILIDAELPKIIKKTAVTGRNGRIKEYIADDDWMITLRGAVFSGVKDTYPADEIRMLTNLCRVNSEIQVASIYLNDLIGVDTLVVERFNLNQRSGMMDAQAFQIKCSSDLPYEITKEVDNV